MEKTVLYIVGCQRSGTSMMSHLFRRDPDSVTYDEVSPLSDKDLVERLRWNPLSEVETRIRMDRAPLVVTKPLVESQNLGELLALFPQTRAIWMYRHFEDVAASNVAFFGEANGLDDLKPVLENDSSDWRAQHLSPRIRDIILEHAEGGLSPWDAAALFWYVRNSLFFSRGYDDMSGIRTCRYSDLVTRPREVMAAAYLFLGREWPGDHIVKDVFSGSRGKGRGLQLAPEIRDLCEELLRDLDSTPRLGGRVC